MVSVATGKPGTSELLMGNEAIARGALEAGVGLAAAGTVALLLQVFVARHLLGRLGLRGGLLSHTLYWSDSSLTGEPEPHIKALREAIALA